MTHASVFSGIGGPEVAATMLGWENLFHCEINPFGRQVLDYWYPNSKSYEDITTTDFTEWRGRVDVLTGGFPCQPFSYAGRRRGAEDDRYLWPSMYRAIDEIQPTWVVAENVAGILTMVEQGEVSKVAGSATLFDAFDDLRGRYELRETFTLQRICTDLESHGYAVQPVLVPACAVGAPHRRDRVFIVARRIASDTDNRADRRTAREDEGKGREERIQERHEVRKPDEPNQVRPEGGDAVEHRHAADTIDEGLQGRHDCDTQGHGQSSDGCTRQLREVHGGERPTTDTQEQSGERMRPEQSEVSRPQQEQSGGRDSEDGCGRASTDTDMLGRRGGRLCGDSERYWETTDGLFEAFRGMYNDGVRRQRESEVCGERWRGFPSVSPVHRGNDGLPFDVDRLTLSFGKWRTEALKAYGNAIVPQVMYEIFRAIEIVEQASE